MRLIAAVVHAAWRHAALVLVGFVVLAGLGLTYTVGHLGIDTNTDHLFAASLPWRQAEVAEARNFPQFENLLVGVVRAATPEEAQETAATLNAALQADHADFKDSSYPSADPFYTQEGLLLLPPADLAKLLGQIVAAQPFLGQLAADPSARGLFTGLGLLAEGAQAGANLTPYTPALNAVAANLSAAAAGHAVPLSWQGLIGATPGQGSAEFVLSHPHLNNGDLQAGGVATAAFTRFAAHLPDVKAGRATVTFTGSIPLSDEQFASLTQGLATGGTVSLFFITLWLVLAVRSWRMILPILLTLVMGLLLTVTFAALTVKVMNLISVAFAILFIGLAVDFAIQYCVRLRDVRHLLPDLGTAQTEAARQAGGQIALAAVAIASGMLAFAPTPFIGVAELGEIAAAGMFIAFACTVTFLPALLRFFAPPGEPEAVGLPGGLAADALLRRYKRLVLAGFAVLALAGAVAMGEVRFDANPLDTQNPNTEAMRTLHTLLADPQTNPFSANALVPNVAAATALSAKLSALPDVAEVISGATFVPDQQDAKLAMLAQARSIMAPTLLVAATPGTVPSAADMRAALTKALAALQAAHPAPGTPLARVTAALAALQGQDDAHLLAVNAAITRFLPLQFSRLGASLNAQPITEANLPASIRADWILPNGQVRVEAYPAASAQSSAGLHRFAAAVLAVDPQAGGSAISTLETAQTILGSFREAALLAFIAIAVILLAVFRNLRDAGLVLVTLALSVLLTALLAKLAGLSINYANIIALPLLLGVGVSFNVYFVMNFRAGMRDFLASATARAVLFSALTTATAFGTLAASADLGTASMGLLLLLSLGAVLIATFLFLPALLYMLDDARPDARKA